MSDLDKVLLEPDRFARVVRDSPLVSIDLIVRTPGERVLVGWRNNEPAKETWFVPGGRICKDESLDRAFRRITRAELGRELDRGDSRSLGVYEHFYDTNFREDGQFGTHYVVLAHELRIGEETMDLPDIQHAQYRWMSLAELRDDPDVHAHVKAYFPEECDR